MIWDDETKPWLKGILESGEITVIFTKKDGTDRTMRCTRSTELIPVRTEQSEKVVRKINEDVLPVYDLDDNHWKSFRYDSIKEIVFS